MEELQQQQSTNNNNQQLLQLEVMMSLKNVININIKLTPRRWTFHLGPNCNLPITTKRDRRKNQLIKVARRARESVWEMNNMIAEREGELSRKMK